VTNPAASASSHAMPDTLRGILPAALTPFDTEWRFDPRAFERLLARIYGAGAHGVYVCGTTGEGLLQSVAQRQAVVEAALANTPPGRRVIVHVGAAAVSDALTLSEHAAKTGAHAISSLPPLSGQFSFDEILGYYELLAAASDLPVLVYYFPELCPSIARLEQLKALCDVPNVVGVKFTDGDLFTMTQLVRPGRLIFNGRDEILGAGLLMGADGGIGSFYNIVPELFVSIYEAAQAGAWLRVRALQQRVSMLVKTTQRFSLFPAIKQIMSWSGLDCGGCLAPRRRLDEAEQRRLRADLVAAGFADLISER
jgi:N-acetylneuraminate lyase